MRFWDSSAIVPLLPLLLDEVATPAARGLPSENPAVCVWSLTEVEAYSALRRRTRATPPLDRLSASWRVVEDQVAVLGHARRLLDAYPLKAADALQLAAAWVFHEGFDSDRSLVVFDELLAAAATGEGFRVLTLDASGRVRKT